MEAEAPREDAHGRQSLAGSDGPAQDLELQLREQLVVKRHPSLAIEHEVHWSAPSKLRDYGPVRPLFATRRSGRPQRATPPRGGARRPGSPSPSIRLNSCTQPASDEARAVGRDAERLGRHVGVEARELAARGGGVPARREVLDVDARGAALVLSHERDRLPVGHPARAAERDRRPPLRVHRDLEGLGLPVLEAHDPEDRRVLAGEDAVEDVPSVGRHVGQADPPVDDLRRARSRRGGSSTGPPSAGCRSCRRSTARRGWRSGSRRCPRPASPAAGRRRPRRPSRSRSCRRGSSSRGAACPSRVKAGSQFTWDVGHAAQVAGRGRHEPQVHPAAAVRGEGHPLAVGRVDRLAVGGLAAREPAAARAAAGRERHLAQVLARRARVEDDAPVAEHVEDERARRAPGLRDDAARSPRPAARGWPCSPPRSPPTRPAGRRSRPPRSTPRPRCCGAGRARARSAPGRPRRPRARRPAARRRGAPPAPARRAIVPPVGRPAGRAHPARHLRHLARLGAVRGRHADDASPSGPPSLCRRRKAIRFPSGDQSPSVAPSSEPARLAPEHRRAVERGARPVGPGEEDLRRRPARTAGSRRGRW